MEFFLEHGYLWKKKNLALTSLFFYYYFNPYNSQDKYKCLRLIEKLGRQTEEY